MGGFARIRHVGVIWMRNAGGNRKNAPWVNGVIMGENLSKVYNIDRRIYKISLNILKYKVLFEQRI